MVEKMKLLHITGPREDIDRVMDVYLSKYRIHFENAIASLSSLKNVRPFVETNIYRDTNAKAQELLPYLAPIEGEPVYRYSPRAAEEIVEEVYSQVQLINQQKENVKQAYDKELDFMHQIEHFRGLDFDFEEILKFQYISFRFGRIPKEYYQKLERYIHDTSYNIFFECGSDESYIWGVYFVPETHEVEVDSVYLSFHFERIYIPEACVKTPEKEWKAAKERLDDLKSKLDQLEELTMNQVMKQARQLRPAIGSLERYCENFDVRKYAVCTKRKDQEGDYYILYGWMEEKQADGFLREIAQDAKIHCIVEDSQEQGEMSTEPPTTLKNPKIFKPFEMFVGMYGLPAYNEMDPTIFIALTYTLMFGIMFGDVGQGLSLVIGGMLLYRIKHMNLAAIIALAGVWSTVFGFLYGSVFGYEDVIEAIWMKPMDNIMTTLELAVGFGMILIIIAMIMNIINCIRAKDYGRLFFHESGMAGLLCYGAGAFSVALMVLGYPLPATAILVVIVGIPLLAIFLKEPLGRWLKKKKELFPEGSRAMFFVEAFVELFDVVLSYATNTISFVRVGAFALSHAGMMGVVFTLAGVEKGSANILIVILGNIVVAALEGLVVGIQVLRLEYYEMFSRFYRGTGKAFVSFNEKKKNSLS